MLRTHILIILLLLASLPLTVLAASASTTVLSEEEERVKSPGSIEHTFDLSEVGKGQQVRLAADMRVDWPGYGGSNPWVVVTVNGKPLTGPNLLNKPVDFTMLCEMDATWVRGNEWRIVMSPDFSDSMRTGVFDYAIPDADPYRFVWDITPFVQAGKNAVVFRHLHLLADGTNLVMKNIGVEVGDPMLSAREAGVKPAPTGPLPTYIAQAARRVPMRVALGSGGSIRLGVAGHDFELTSRTSEPAGEWQATGAASWKPVKQGSSAKSAWAGTGYRVARTVVVRGDHLHIADTITNTDSKRIGVIYENRLALTDAPVEIKLAGKPAYADNQSTASPPHPTVMARWNGLTVGLAAEDDIFRAHITSFKEPKAIGLADRQLGIDPGKSCTLEWSVYPIPNGGYWDFINAVRRNWGSNFTIPGPNAIIRYPTGDKGVDFYKQYVEMRGLRTVVFGQPEFIGDEIAKYGGEHKNKLAFGTNLPLGKQWLAGARKTADILHQIAPGIRIMVYFHAQICTDPEAQKKYADCRVLDADGKHALTPYNYPIYTYLSTLNNAYGKELMRAFKNYFESTHADGIFHDQFAHADWYSYAYDTEWDGCTVMIDPVTHAITGQRSCVVLLQQPWKLALVKYLQDNKKIIFANGPMYTRSLLKTKIPSFVETYGGFSGLVETHLSAPMAMGNNETEETEAARARMTHRMLDFAGLHCAWGWDDDPKTLPHMRVLFPITPEELRPGMVLGKERIATNRSGRYGWKDGADADVYIFDAQGRLVEKVMFQSVLEGKRRLFEIRMPSDFFAILVRKKQ